MTLFAEIWARPGAPTFGRVIDDAPSPNFSFHDGMNVLGDGTMQIASSFDRFDEILLTDSATPSNSVSSLVRIFDSSDPTTPVFEWLPRSILPTTDKFDPNVDVSGVGIKGIMDYARVEAFDWDGSPDWVPTFPDWIYDGPNILSNPGFETPGTQPATYELIITATGGTYTLTDGTDTTSAIAFNANESTIETRLETDITAIDDCIVTPITDGFEIEMIDSAFVNSLAVNTGSLTGGTATVSLIQEGILTPTPWQRSQQINVGTPIVYGEYDAFEVSTAQAHSGTYSLLINPAAIGLRYAGAQQVVNVTPGGTYQASVWVYTGGSSQDYRFVVRGLDEDLIDFAQATPTANTWTELSIADITIPDGTTSVIFRIANINQTGNPSAFYVDDGALKEGAAAASVGQIIRELYEDATSDHAGRIVWEDEANSPTPYLSLDFSDTLDSNGDAWLYPTHAIKLWMRMSYRQVLDQFARTWGYEWRVVPNDVEAGTWYLQIYNPGGMGTDYSSAASPAIQAGSRDISRGIRQWTPAATDFMVEGEQRITARYTDTSLETALGRIEGSRLDRQNPSQESVSDGAFQDAVDGLVNSVDYEYELVDPTELPLLDYAIGSALTIHDPPDIDDVARLIDAECVRTPTGTTWSVQFSPETAAGS